MNHRITTSAVATISLFVAGSIGIRSTPAATQSNQDPPGARQKVRDRIEKRLGERDGAGAARPDADKSVAAAGTEERKIDHAGKTRTYRLHLPKGFSKDKPVPLVIVLHGAGANGAITEILTGFSPVADHHGFAVVYPDGQLGLWNFWEQQEAAKAKLARRGNDDIGFLSDLIDSLVKDGVADRTRVYVTGISNGAFMSNRLGCDLGDKIAAIAPVSGTMPRIMADKVKPPRAMPVLYFHGSEDKLVGIDGTDFITKRNASLSASDLVEWWAKHNGCEMKPKTESLPDKADDGTTVTRTSYPAGKSGAPVTFYSIDGGGHTWPGGSAQPEGLLGKTSRDIVASELIWEFFAKFKLPDARE